MRAIVLGLFVAATLIGCGPPTPQLTTTSGASSSGTSSSSTASGSSGTSTGSATSGTSSSGSTSGSGSTTGTTGISGLTGTSGTTGSGTTTGTTGTTGTTTGPGGPCGPGMVWFGDRCAAADCSLAQLDSVCAFVDGGFGICGTKTCMPDYYCGSYGVVCPYGYYCQGANCWPSQGNWDCTMAKCPGTFESCVPYLGCIPGSCGSGSQGQACVLDGGYSGQSFVPKLGACCSTDCLDYRTDPANCGNCGLACGQGQVCSSGVCTMPVVCGATENGRVCAMDAGGAGTCCLGGCVDLQSDSANCGFCSAGCDVGASCVDGVCSYVSGGSCPVGTALSQDGFCSPVACGADSLGALCTNDAGSPAAYRYFEERCCDAGCTDTSYDSNNCGGCGVVCPPDSGCLGGTCFAALDCSQPDTDSLPCILDGGAYVSTCCRGSCEDLNNGAADCYACGQTCPSGSRCSYGVCVTDGGTAASCNDGGCPVGTLCTNGYCFAGVSCSSLPARSTCIFDAGTFLSFGGCCGDECIDLQSDSSNCGTCRNTCPTGVACTTGFCASGCSATAPCPTGTLCITAYPGYPGNCEPLDCSGQPDGVGCAFGPGVFPFNTASGACCSGSCVGPNDPQNCGGCGQSCSSGICNFDVCLEPNPRAICELSCPPDTRCDNGVCVNSLCSGVTSEGSGYVPLCLASDGTIGNCCLSGGCGNLLDDPQNCGVCGIVCPAGQTCANGTCSGSPTCGPGHMGELCDLDAGTNFVCCPGAGCIDVLAYDQNNCGGCGYYCLPGTHCDAGFCG